MSTVSTATLNTTSGNPASLRKSTKIEHVEKSTLISPIGNTNILGLADYASDDEDEETQSSVIASSVPLDDVSLQKKNNVDTAVVASNVGKEIYKEKTKESNGDKGTSLDRVLHHNEKDKFRKEYSESIFDFCRSPSKNSQIPPEIDKDHERKQFIKEKIVKERGSVYEQEGGHSGSPECRKNKMNHASMSRDSIDKRSHKEVETGVAKLAMRFSDNNDHKKSHTKDQTKEKTGKLEKWERTSKCQDSKQDKITTFSESRKRNTYENNEKPIFFESERKVRADEDYRKRDCKESARSDKAGQGKRDFHRHRSRHHSPSSSVVNSKKNHFAGPGSDEDVSDDSKKR